MSKVIVIGGGPAGMMAAGTAGKNNNDVLLFEKNYKLGKKLYITGKGRSNFTNKTDVETMLDNVVNNRSFLYSAFYSMDNNRLISFFENLGLKSKVERGNRVFPKSDKASDVTKALKKYLKDNNVEIIHEKVIKILKEDNKIIGIKTNKDQTYYSEKVILAAGGATYKSTGSTGDCYNLAKNIGHSIIPIYPSLVPLELYEKSEIKRLEGLTLKNVEIKIKDTSNQIIFSEFGDMVFTENGVSGPIILSASSNLKQVKNKNYILSIDLKAALDYQTLDNRLKREFKKYANKNFKNALNDLLPSKMIYPFLDRTKIDTNKKVNQLTKDERETVLSLLKEFNFTISDYVSFDRGIVTSGGIDVKQINPSSMESKLINGLYFAGEIMDVDAYTGGFNLHIAFATGYLAGINV
ncbi:MAG: NAD(P)/FAD-dependent oxidoreductase [Halanaerobiales bacterium]|nr:NAD(P)/FAD-dependent oxidoreductase [Halanaerobiales bacterium]